MPLYAELSDKQIIVKQLATKKLVEHMKFNSNIIGLINKQVRYAFEQANCDLDTIQLFRKELVDSEEFTDDEGIFYPAVKDSYWESIYVADPKE